MPYLGVATQTGEQGQRYSSGGVFGALVGGRLNQSFSLNGELRLDSLDFRNVPSTTAASGTELDIGLSPLFHAQFATGEFVIGPKLSFFTHQESYPGFDINGFTRSTTRTGPDGASGSTPASSLPSAASCRWAEW